LPGEKEWKVLQGLPSKNMIGINRGMSVLQKGEGPFDLGLFILELIPIEGDIEPA
jgi:hypothetical protein